MKKLVLTTLAACMATAMTGVYAESTIGKEPIRLAQAAPKGVDDATPSGKTPTSEKDRAMRKGRTGKDSGPEAKSTSEVNPSGKSPTADKDRPARKSRTGSTRTPPEAGSVSEANPSGASSGAPTATRKAPDSAK